MGKKNFMKFFHLEDAGMVLVHGAKDKGDVKNTDGLRKAYELGESMEGWTQERIFSI